MSFVKSIVLAFSIFTRLPVPSVDWDPKNMRFLMASLPIVGMVVGALAAAWCLVADALGFNYIVKAVGIALVPLAITGGFHLDGFADVVDAQSSHAEPARKREILKDPHVGSFAVMGVVAYLMAYFALATAFPTGWQAAVLLICVHVMTRSGSGFASSVFWGNGEQGMLSTFRSSVDVRLTVGIVATFFVVAAIASLALAPLAGCAMVVCEALLLTWLNWFAQRNFGGMSGDLAGFFLQACEIVLLACIVIAMSL